MASFIAVLRCDASLAIGSGHVMRCRSLARALEARGAEIVFLCRRQTGDLIGLLEQEFRVLVLSRHSQAVCKLDAQPHPLHGKGLYAAWLGCSEEQDALESLTALADAQLQPPAWLVVDHYGLGALWQQRLKEGLRLADGSSPAVLVLDDLANRAHQASVLVDPNRLNPARQDPYLDLVPNDCATFLGPAYALLDPIYPRLQSLLSSRTHIARLLVFFGGTDSANHAALALEALSHPSLSHLAVDVVVGAASPHFAELESVVRQRSNACLHVGLTSLAGLMSRADLALGAAGTASWERACLGLPSLVIPVAENQEQGARALQAAGVARCLNLLSDVDPVSIVQASILALINAPDALKAMSEACLQLGDGRGTARVVAALLGPAPGLRVRPAQATDLWLYHWWANDPQVRRQSFTTDSIPLEEHRRWFARRLNSPLVLLRVLEDKDGLPLGQIRFERSTERDPRAEIGFSIDRLARGRGFARLLLQLGLEELYRSWGHEFEAFGQVRAENSASCRAFLRAGFREGTSQQQGVRSFSKFAFTSFTGSSGDI